MFNEWIIEKLKTLRGGRSNEWIASGRSSKILSQMQNQLEMYARLSTISPNTTRCKDESNESPGLVGW